MKTNDSLFLILLFTLFGIVISFDTRSFYTIPLTIAMAFLFIFVYAIVADIKSWLLDREANRLNASEKTDEGWAKDFLKKHGIDITK